MKCLNGVVVATLCNLTLLGQSSIFDLLPTTPGAPLTLEVSFGQIEANRRTLNQFPAIIRFEDATGQPQTWPLQVAVRGKFRRGFCALPPLALSFPKEALVARGLAPHNDYKLVTHCLADTETGSRLTAREYLIYQLYRELTPYSFRAKILQITYRNQDNGKEAAKAYGIIIEDENELGQRFKAKDCGECRVMNQGDIDVSAETMMAVFQYFVANTDWAAVGRRNLKVYRDSTNGPMIPVPYDFDWSGFVEAPYAIPNSALNLSSTRERLYLGFQPIDREVMNQILTHFTERKAALYQIIEQSTLLGKGEKSNLIRFLESFYRRDAARLLKP